MFPDYIHRAAGFYFRKETIPMNLQNMEYLIEISNCGSISAAAKHLFVTQPYLSKVLRETEKEYGLTSSTRNILRPPLRNTRKLTACGSPPAAVPTPAMPLSAW